MSGFVEYNEHYQQQMQKIGNNCSLLLESLQQSHSKDWQRCARGIISLRKVYSDELIDKACHRALHYSISSYSKIKNILNSNAVNLPLSGLGHICRTCLMIYRNFRLSGIVNSLNDRLVYAQNNKLGFKNFYRYYVKMKKIQP